MKKILILFTLLLSITAQAKDVIIDRPAYVTNTAMFELSLTRVELSKKGTTVHFKVVNAKWGKWSMAEARLVTGADTLTFKSGRVVTHDGTTVLAEEAFEMGKQYEKNVQRDSLILTFEPLPKGAKTFDCYVKNGRRTRQITGIRVDDRLYPALLPHLIGT